MKSEGVLLRFAGVFVAALALYMVAYSWIEHRRTAKGPWRVTFAQGTSGVPVIMIQQSSLGISNVNVNFSGVSAPVDSTNKTQTLTFGSARAVPYPLPFGNCVYQDLTFLPGSVVFEMYGHEIELLPRVLVVDRQEKRWVPNSTIVLQPSTNTRPARP